MNVSNVKHFKNNDESDLFVELKIICNEYF